MKIHYYLKSSKFWAFILFIYFNLSFDLSKSPFIASRVGPIIQASKSANKYTTKLYRNNPSKLVISGKYSETNLIWLLNRLLILLKLNKMEPIIKAPWEKGTRAQELMIELKALDAKYGVFEKLDKT